MEPAASWAGQECDGGDMGENHSMLRRPARGRYAVATVFCFVLFGLIHCVRFELCFVSCFPVLAMSCLCALACSLVSGRTSSETADSVREPFFACVQGRAKRKRAGCSRVFETNSQKQMLLQLQQAAPRRHNRLRWPRTRMDRSCMDLPRQLIWDPEIG